MGTVSTLMSCVLLVVGDVAAQTAAPPSYERLLPQWLTGIIAVSGFLLLTFIGFLVKKVWCEESSRRNSVESVKANEYVMSETYDTRLDIPRNRESTESDKESEYETSLDALRNRESVKSEKENEYETSLDALRNRSSVKSEKENEYETSLEVLRNKEQRNAFDNLGMVSGEEKATAM